MSWGDSTILFYEGNGSSRPLRLRQPRPTIEVKWLLHSQPSVDRVVHQHPGCTTAAGVLLLRGLAFCLQTDPRPPHSVFVRRWQAIRTLSRQGVR